MSTTSTLNKLIEILKDGQEGFKAAAEDLQNPQLQSALRGFASQREQFATQLQVLARDFGDENPTHSGSIAGALHRGWIDLKSALASHNAHAILAECERGEDAAVQAYRDAFEPGELPAQVADVLRQQFAEVQTAHDTVKHLRDSLAA